MKKAGFTILLVVGYSLIISCSSAEVENIIPSNIEDECKYHLPFPSNLYQQVKISQPPLNPDPLGSHHEGILKYAYDFSLREYLAQNSNISEINIVASSDGIVSRTHEGETGCGCEEKKYKNKANYVIIDHRNGEFSVYLHLKSVSVKKGQDVKKGDKIGVYGNTGWTCCNAHLHYQVQKKGNKISQSIETCFREYQNKVIIAAPKEKVQADSSYIISAEDNQINSWKLSWTPSYSLSFDPNKWGVKNKNDNPQTLVLLADNNCYIIEKGPMGFPEDISIEDFGSITYIVVDRHNRQFLFFIVKEPD